MGCKDYRTSALSRHAETCDHKNALMAATMQTDLKKAMEKALSQQEEGINNSSKSSVLACERKCGYTKIQFIDESATSDTLPTR